MAFAGKDGFCVTKDNKIVCEGSSGEVFKIYHDDISMRTAVQKDDKWCRIDEADRFVCDQDHPEMFGPGLKDYPNLQLFHLKPFPVSVESVSRFRYEIDGMGDHMHHLYKDGKPCGCEGETCDIQCKDDMHPALFHIGIDYLKTGDKYCDVHGSRIRCNSDDPVQDDIFFRDLLQKKVLDR